MDGPRPAHFCPECGSEEIDRVRRDGVRDHLARLLGWHVYRCRECGCEFYDRPS